MTLIDTSGGVPIFRYFATNLSASTHVPFSLFLQISYLILPHVCFLTTLSTTRPATFSGELFIAIPRRDRALHSRCVFLLEETVYPVVRLPSWYTTKAFPIFPGRPRPSIGVPVAFNNDSRTRLNCFPIRYLLNIRPCWIKRECVIFL